MTVFTAEKIKKKLLIFKKCNKNSIPNYNLTYILTKMYNKTIINISWCKNESKQQLDFNKAFELYKIKFVFWCLRNHNVSKQNAPCLNFQQLHATIYNEIIKLNKQKYS